MVNLQKSGDSAVKFVFTDSDHYLYGNGEIEVPVNSLLLVIDESDMVTFKKLSGDPFLSFRADNSNLGTKAAIEQFYKDNMVGSTGGGSESGITPSEIQDMIDESISGKADTSVVNQAISEASQAILSVSGDVQTKVATTDFNTYSAATATALNGKVDTSALNDYYTKTEVYNKQEVDTAYETAYQALTAHTADTTVHVTSLEKDAWNAKQDALYIYTEDNNLGTAELHSNDSSIIFNAGGASITANNVMGENTFNVASTGVTINGDAVATEPYVDAALSGKADTSAVTAAIDAATSGKVDTSAITTAITSGSTDSEIPTAKATYDAIQAGGGGGATYSAGTNISIDTANTINCTLNLRNGTQANSLTGVHGEVNAENSFAFGQNSTAGTRTNDNYAFAFGYGCKARKGRSFAYGATNDVKEIDSAAFGSLITLNAPRSFAAGYHNVTNNWVNIALGEELRTNNRPEFATGAYNNSVTGSTASGQTLFSVGNGTSDSARHNAFEIRQNGDIYVNDGTNDVRLQDTILALGGLKFVQCTQAEYDALVSGGTVDSSTIYFITNVVS